MTNTCPHCGSYAMVDGTNHDGQFYSRCAACGTTFFDYEDEHHAGDNPADDYDVCREEGHDWQLVTIAGEDCFECVRCAAIDC